MTPEKLNSIVVGVAQGLTSALLLYSVWKIAVRPEDMLRMKMASLSIAKKQADHLSVYCSKLMDMELDKISA